MNSGNEVPDPFDVVARALKRPRESVTEDSAKYRDHGWDSLGHLSVIMEIERALGISIGDDDAWKLDSMKAISEFFERHRGGGPEP